MNKPRLGSSKPFRDLYYLCEAVLYDTATDLEQQLSDGEQEIERQAELNKRAYELWQSEQNRLRKNASVMGLNRDEWEI